MLKTIYQKANDLQLNIISADLPLSLSVYQKEAVGVGAWQFEFHIIGESHHVCIRHDNAVWLQEVLACIDLPQHPEVEKVGFADLAPWQTQRNQYQVAVDFAYGEGHLLENPQLSMRFPSVYGQEPITQIQWDVTPTQMRWQTLHLYPTQQEMVSVLTESRVHL